MPPRIGPMQGVHPNANATPTSMAPSGPAGLRRACTRFSTSRNRSRNTPIVCRPKTIRMTPAILLRSGSRANMNFPTAVADAPSAMNTIEKPITNASEVRNTCRRELAGAASVPRISSIDTPETNEMYPGMSGSTHGETKDKNPAAKAARSVKFWFIRGSRPGPDSVDLLQADRRERSRGQVRRRVELHRSQVLEHHVPLPPLRRVRRLQPVFRPHRAGEGEIGQPGVGGVARPVGPKHWL